MNRSVLLCASVLAFVVVLCPAADPPIPKPELQKLTESEKAKAWALACSAVPTEPIHWPHDSLAPCETTEINVAAVERILKQSWAVKSRADLSERLLWRGQTGDRAAFDEACGMIRTVSPTEYAERLQKISDSPEDVAAIEYIWKYCHELGDKSLLGWDIAIYIMLCRLGYVAGHITEEEAWSMIIPAAGILQRTFDSWEDLGRNFLIGQEGFHPEGTEDNRYYYYADAFQRLLDMPSSPWNKYPWNTDLGEIPKEIPQLKSTPLNSANPRDK